MSGETRKTKKISRVARWIFLSILLIVFSVTIVYGFYRPYSFNVNISKGHSGLFTKSASILIFGDMMLDRNVRNIINEKGFDEFFKGVKKVVQSVDVAVVNLEGAFTTYPSITAGLDSDELIFTFDPALSPALYDLGFDVLGLANNHSYNFGKDGLEMTRRYIGSSGMFYYGDPFNRDEVSTVITKNGIKIGLVGFHEFYYVNFDRVFSEIARLRSQVDVLIVTPHWGVEYQKEPTDRMVEWAHGFINRGADTVIGAHPHIVGDVEEYKGKKIYYSLGNFAFDQYFSEETMNGLGVLIKVEKGPNENIRLEYEDIRVRVDRDGVGVI